MYFTVYAFLGLFRDGPVFEATCLCELASTDVHVRLYSRHLLGTNLDHQTWSPVDCALEGKHGRQRRDADMS